MKREISRLERALLADVKAEIKLAKQFMAVQYRGTPYAIKASWRRFAKAIDEAGFREHIGKK